MHCFGKTRLVPHVPSSSWAGKRCYVFYYCYCYYYLLSLSLSLLFLLLLCTGRVGGHVGVWKPEKPATSSCNVHIRVPRTRPNAYWLEVQGNPFHCWQISCYLCPSAFTNQQTIYQQRQQHKTWDCMVICLLIGPLMVFCHRNHNKYS